MSQDSSVIGKLLADEGLCKGDDVNASGKRPPLIFVAIVGLT